jgi:hypothetical protein
VNPCIEGAGSLRNESLIIYDVFQYGFKKTVGHCHIIPDTEAGVVAPPAPPSLLAAAIFGSYSVSRTTGKEALCQPYRCNAISLASLFIGVSLLGKYLHLPQSFLLYGFMILFTIYCYSTFYLWRKFNLNFSQNIDEIQRRLYLLQTEFSGYSERTYHSASSSSDGYKSMN